MGNATSRSDFGYAGDITPIQAWDILHDQSDAVLVDVRTPQEWSMVGMPQLSSLAKDVITISWRVSPSMEVNQKFTSQIQSESLISKDTPILLLCRSGGRSREAAIALTQAGYTQCYNIAGGFEGVASQCGTDGWKSSRLPWEQNTIHR